MGTCFIFTLIDYICPMVIVKVFPNQKPWVVWSIYKASNAWTAVYDNLGSGNMSELSYELMNYRGSTNTPAVEDPSLVEDLNSFYACFNSSIRTTSITVLYHDSTKEDHPLSLLEHDVRRALRGVNCRKAAPVSGLPNCPHMFQVVHYCPWTQEDKLSLLKELSPCSSHICGDEVLWETY